MDINSLVTGLLGSLDASSAAIKSQQGSAAATTADITRTAEQQESALTDARVKSQQSDSMKAAIEQRKLAYGEYAQQVAGLNPEDLNNEYVQTMANLTATREARDAEMAKYRRLTETSFLDNPIGYIFNQLALPTVVQAHNNLAMQQDALTSDLSTRTALMAQNKASVTANVAGATKDQMLAESAANAAKAQAQLLEVHAANLGRISTAQMNELALQAKLADNQVAKYRVGMDVAQFNALQEERAAARVEREAARAERLAAAKTRDEAKAIQDAQDSALAAGLARVSAALGKPLPITLDDFKRMPASKRKQALYNAATDNQFGTTLAESIDFLKTGNLTTMQTTDPGFVYGIRSIAAEIKNTGTKLAAANPTIPLAEIEQQAAQTYEHATYAAAHDPKAARPLNDPTWDSQFTAYKPRDLDMLTAIKSGKMPALAGNSYVSALETVASQLPPTATEFRGEDQTNAIKTLAALVGQRKIPLAKAGADLAAYMNAAAKFNQDTFKLATLGLLPQTSAYVRIPSSVPMVSPAVGDIMTPVGAENVLAKVASNTLVGVLKREANPFMGAFGLAGLVGATSANAILDTTPTK